MASPEAKGKWTKLHLKIMSLSSIDSSIGGKVLMFSSSSLRLTVPLRKGLSITGCPNLISVLTSELAAIPLMWLPNALRLSISLAGVSSDNSQCSAPTRSQLAQKMVDAAVAKAKELGVRENVTILDDGGNLKAFSRMDGAPILSIEIAQNKAYTALFGVSTQDLFNLIQGDPSLLAGMPTLPRMAAWGGGFPIKVNGEIVGGIGLSGAPTVQNDVDCAMAALALVPEAAPAD